MVKSGGFISGVAAALGLPEPTAAGAFRVLRESGLMTSGARGVNAPDMTDLDAARMLIAMLVSERPAYAELSVRDFGQLVCVHSYPARLPEGYELSAEYQEVFQRMTAAFTLTNRGLPERHSLEQAVAEIIRMYGDDAGEDYWRQSSLDESCLGPNVVIEIVAGDLVAKINMNGNIHVYEDRLVDPDSWGNGETPEEIAADLDAEEAHELKRSRYQTAIRNVRSVDTTQIQALAGVIRGPST